MNQKVPGVILKPSSPGLVVQFLKSVVPGLLLEQALQRVAVSTTAALGLIEPGLVAAGLAARDDTVVLASSTVAKNLRAESSRAKRKELVNNIKV